MEFITDLITGAAGVAAGAAGGGIFGLIGAITGQISKHFQEKAAREFKKQEWAHEESLFDRQIALGKSETENEIAIVSSQGAWDGLSESIKADASTRPQSGIAADIKALFRPFLTLMLVICTMYIIHSLLNNKLNDIMEPGEAKELIKYAIDSIVFSTSAAITWWFGDRALTPAHLKHR